jgi:ribosome-binding factor A
VKLRYTPSLRFYIDDSLDHAQRINSILDSVRPAEESTTDDA